MEFQYKLAPEDYAAFSRHLCGPDGKVRLSVMTRFMVLGAAALSALSSLAFRHRLTSSDMYVLAFGVAWAGITPWWFARGVAKRMRTLAQAGGTPGGVGFHELVVDDAGITDRTDYGVHLRLWKGIQRVDETPTHLFIHYGERSAFIVPRSWLGDASTRLRDAVQDRLRPMAGV